MAVQPQRTAANDGAGRRLGELGRRTAKWVLGVLVVSLVLPAVTKQWSDNQQQHQLKADVSSRLAAAVAGATTDSGFLLSNQLQSIKSPSETASSYEDTLSGWKREASAIDAQIAGYFATTSDPSKDDLVIAIGAYNNLVQDYIGLCTFYKSAGLRKRYLDGFDKNLEKMREHVGGVPSNVVPPLVARSGHGPLPRNLNAFREQAQNEWAPNIVDTSAPIIATVSRRQPHGLHVGAGAFIHQVFHPFG